MDDELYVVISRTPSDYICSEVPISEIEGVMWDNISGGVKNGQSGYSLYGYISYKLATETVKCSGRHDFGDNSAKICIPAAKIEMLSIKRDIIYYLNGQVINLQVL